MSELVDDLAHGDHEAAAKLFAENGALEDLALHTSVAGPQSVGVI